MHAQGNDTNQRIEHRMRFGEERPRRTADLTLERLELETKDHMQVGTIRTGVSMKIYMCRNQPVRASPAAVVRDARSSSHVPRCSALPGARYRSFQITYWCAIGDLLRHKDLPPNGPPAYERSCR
mmetsp:Transcript_1577/g.9722  ORF Transcript_1577/g.9722 Transcript_1577/m.9722 type:complete len:125 (-) Transcript_1577:1515-1889(-)